MSIPVQDKGLNQITQSAANYLAELKAVLDRLDLGQVTTVIDRLRRACERGGFVYIFGNGGSASTASHFVNDFNKGINPAGSYRFRFVCLNDNVPTVLALANDISYDAVFTHQLRTFVSPLDLVIAISASGDSANVVDAVRYANDQGVETIALVGHDGGQLRRLADFCVHVPIHDTQKVEDVHLALNHLMMVALKEFLEEADHKNHEDYEDYEGHEDPSDR